MVGTDPLASRPLGEPTPAAALVLPVVPWSTVLVEIALTDPTPLTLRLADHYVPATYTGDEWLPLVAGWGDLEESQESGPGSAEVIVSNTRPLAGRARASDLIRTPGNLTTSWEWVGATVTLTRLAAGPALPVVLGVFAIEEASEDDDRLLHLRLRDASLRLEHQAALTLVTRAAFPACAADLVGQPIPRPLGRLTGVPCLPLVAGTLGRLVGDVDAAAATLTVTRADGTDLDADDLAAELVLVDQEEVTFTTRTGNVLTGCTRGANGTTAAAHADGAAVLELLTEYVYVVGEHGGGFPVRAVGNVLAEGALAAPPTVTLDEVLGGRHVATVRFPRASILPLTGVPLGPLDVSVASAGFSLPNGTANGTDVVRTVEVPAAQVPATATIRALTFGANRAGTGGNTVGVVECRLYRRLASEAAPGDLIFTHTWATLVIGSASTAQERTLPTTEDEIITVKWSAAGTLDGGSIGFSFGYTVAVPESGLPARPGGPHASAADEALGAVTCDVEGIADDAAGSLTGAPGSLLENPADVLRYLVTALYAAGGLPLGTSWAGARAALAARGLAWAVLFGAGGAVALSDVRVLAARQSGGALYVEGGAWEFRVYEDPIVIDQVLAYDRDVWEGQPGIVTRTPATDVYTVVEAAAGLELQGGGYRLTARAAVAGVPEVKQTLELPWVQAQAAADALVAYWLTVWQRPRWEVELVGWQNLLGRRLGDHIAVSGHPILEAHGGAALAFRIGERGHQLSAEHPERIRLRAVEAGP